LALEESLSCFDDDHPEIRQHVTAEAEARHVVEEARVKAEEKALLHAESEARLEEEEARLRAEAADAFAVVAEFVAGRPSPHAMVLVDDWVCIGAGDFRRGARGSGEHQQAAGGGKRDEQDESVSCCAQGWESALNVH